jgi:hypothetical protein
MTDLDALVDQLAAQATPVKRLASPLRRTLGWLSVAVIIVAIITAFFGWRHGWLQGMDSTAAWIEWSASVATAVLAAYAAFQISVPGRAQVWAWLPLPAVLLWLGVLGWSCARDIAHDGVAALSLQSDGASCACTILLLGMPLAGVLLWKVRHAGVVRPGATALLAGLSTAALAAAGVSLIHEGEAARLVLLWHMGSVTLLASLAWLFSRQLFSSFGLSSRDTLKLGES